MFVGFLTGDDARRESRRRHEDALNELPPQVRNYVQALERDARQSVKSIREEAAKATRPLHKTTAELNADIAAKTAELDAARLWLADVPAEATTSETVERYTIAQTWPSRIDKLRAQLADVSAQIARHEKTESARLDDVRVSVDSAIQDVTRRLSALRINVLD